MSEGIGDCNEGGGGQPVVGFEQVPLPQNDKAKSDDRRTSYVTNTSGTTSSRSARLPLISSVSRETPQRQNALQQ